MKLLRLMVSVAVSSIAVAGGYSAGNIDTRQGGAAPQAFVVADSLERTLTFDHMPERIVLAGKAVLSSVNAVYLFPQATKSVVAVGATDQGLGDFYPFIDPAHREKKRYPNNVGPEEIASAKPDLVVLKYYLKGQLGDQLETLGIPVLYLNLESPEKYLSDVRMLGTLFQDDHRAGEIVQYFETRRRLIENATLNVRPPRVLVLSYSERDGDATFNIPPADWIQTEMVETAGGFPVWKRDATGNGWQKVSFEQIAAWRPEFVFLISYRNPSVKVAKSLRASVNWQAIISEQQVQVLPFPADYYSWDQADARWILGLQWIAKTLHPDRIENLDLVQEVRVFYRELYGMGHDIVNKEILPKLAGVIF